MERKTKIALIITGSVLVAGGLAVGLYFLLRKPKSSDDNLLDQNTGSKSKTQSGSNSANISQNSGAGSSSSSSEIAPKFNAEDELINPLSHIKGRVLYPKRETSGGWGYTNVRTSAEVNNNQGWWDGLDNLITTINSGTPIGTVLSETTGLFNGYSYRWFKVKLTKPTGGFWSNYTEGYVRADTVTFQAYTP